MRGVGETAIAAAMPDWAVLLAGLLTQLGDAWFVFALAAGVYWLGDAELAPDPRRAGATLLALGLLALGVTVALKSVFALPRPPGAGEATPPIWVPEALAPLFVDIATGEGFGFPSGHTIGSTIIYGGLAARLGIWDRRRRWRVAAVVIGLVGLTRVLLGVHYLVDVVAGVVAGAVALAATLRLAGDAPERAFVVAGAVNLGAVGLALALSHPGEALKAAIGAGSALGGVVAWRRVGPDLDPVSWRAGLVGGAVAGGLWTASYALAGDLVVAAAGSAVALGVIVGLPALATRADPDRRTAAGE